MARALYFCIRWQTERLADLDGFGRVLVRDEHHEEIVSKVDKDARLSFIRAQVGTYILSVQPIYD